MTPVRMQPLAASTAMLAAEHARLDRAKAQLEKEIAEMNAAQVPTGDDLVRALASEIAAEEARIAAKRAALERAEAALQTQRRDTDAERARAAADARQALCDELAASAEEMFAAVERAEAHLRAFTEEVNAALKANVKTRGIVKQLLPQDAKVPMGLALNDFVHRLGGRIMVQLRQVKVPGALGTPRLGGLDLPDVTGLFPAADDWGERERHAQGRAIAEILAHGRETQ